MWKKTAALLLLMATPAFYIPAQTTQATQTAQTSPPTILESKDIPQWVKDIRRWEIVAFGSIPFTMFTATFAMDMYRWNNANGLDFNDLRYAPWPLKSAGAEMMESKEQELVFVIAASMSVAIAFTDLIIVQIKRHRERRRAEAIPVGSTIITRTPMFEEASEENDAPSIDGSPSKDGGIEADEAAPVTVELPVPAEP